MTSALEKFNSKHKISMERVSLVNSRRHAKDSNFRFVFTNTFKGECKRPLLLSLSYEELANTKSEGAIVDLLERKLIAEVKSKESEHSIWIKDFIYDLPRGKTELMLCFVPGHLRGIEEDAGNILGTYLKQYGATASTILTTNKEKLEKEVAGLRKDHSFAEVQDATKENILKGLENGLIKAIKEGKGAFVFHFTMHGNPDEKFKANDESITAEEITAILKKEVNGKSIASQIAIDLVGEQCFSGVTGSKIIEDLQKNKTEVKSLNVINSSTRVESYAGVGSDSASISSNRINDFHSGAFAYYFTVYYELIDAMKKSGIKLDGEAGTFSHAMRFIDRMAAEDSFTDQNTQAIHYSYNPETKEQVLKRFADQRAKGKELSYLALSSRKDFLAVA